jgi:DNA-binding transcriptional LysR family regulator
MSRTKLKLKGLSLDRLETLSQIVSQGSIAQASGGNPNKQSQFSRQVAELEDWFGLPLLDPSSVPNKPTAAALRISREVEAFMSNLGSVRENAVGGRRVVVFGTGERMIRSYLVPWAAKIREPNLRWVFRNLTSAGVRGELLAKRIDFGILRKDHCPAGLASVGMKPIPMCLLLPEDGKKTKRKLKWEDLAEMPLIILEGDGAFKRFLMEKASGFSVELDVMTECSSWTQVIDSMSGFKAGGFLPKDMEKQFPAGFSLVQLAGLQEYADEYVIAWSPAEAAKRPEIGRLARHLGGR